MKIKIRAKQAYNDKETKKQIKKDAILEVTEKRLAEMQEFERFDDYIEIIEEPQDADDAKEEVKEVPKRTAAKK